MATTYWLDGTTIFENGQARRDFSESRPDAFTTVSRLDEGGREVITVEQAFPTGVVTTRYVYTKPEGRVIESSTVSRTSATRCMP